ncbi:hypothetical protein HY310_01220 [Candidatus Microgenomates bacterium]|nr:hypothetical protein [Candidatus Microgenomates bacterium]
MQTLSVHIVSPVDDIFVGEATSVSSKNSAGVFDILPEHANFITLIDENPIIVRLPSGEKKEFTLPKSVLRCWKNHIEIFADLSKAELLLPEPKSFI